MIERQMSTVHVIEFVGGPKDGERIKFVDPEEKMTVSVNGVDHIYHLREADDDLLYIAEGYHGQLVNETGALA